MDSFFGIGSMELVVILIIAAIVMGPERIAQTARWLGKTTAYLQSLTRGFSAQLQKELEVIDQDGQIQQALHEVQETKRVIQNEVSQARRHMAHMGQEVAGDLAEEETAVSNRIAPPRPSSPPPPLPKPIPIPDDND